MKVGDFSRWLAIFGEAVADFHKCTFIIFLYLNYRNKDWKKVILFIQICS
jgi:hypothetical protein